MPRYIHAEDDEMMSDKEFAELERATKTPE